MILIFDFLIGDDQMFIVLFLVWLILNGKITFEIIWMGLLITAMIYAFMCKFMDFSFKKDIKLCKRALLGIAYVFVLLWEILKANLTVINIILNKRRPIKQSIRYFNTSLKSKMAKVILANSITLTPGTITVSVDDDRFCVHCLSSELLDGIETSSFVKLLEKMEA